MKNYIGTTRTLETGDTGFRSVIFKPAKPPLDSELTYSNGLPLEFSKLQLQQLANSGFFPNARAFDIGYDPAGQLFGVNLTDESNKIILKNLSGGPFPVNILGDVIQFGGTNSVDADTVEIVLPAPPGSGSRQDLVFLEVWYTQLFANNAQGKPDATHVYAYGNIESGLPNIDDEIFYGPIGTSTTDRVQVQYRVRVVSGANFGNFPSGVDDNAVVFAQCGQNTESTYTFTPHVSDSGVYVAGDGSPTAQGVLGSVDGKSYAIPLFRIHRRNAAPFSLTNLNGAGNQISDASSDRPDGYYNDKIEAGDIEDLRHVIAIGLNPAEILDGNFKNMLAGNLGTALVESDLSPDVVHSLTGLSIDGFSQFDQTGVSDTFNGPNSQRRAVSDALTVQRTTQKVILADRTLGLNPNWTMTDQLTIQLQLPSPTGSKFGKRVKLFGIVEAGGSQDPVEIPVAVNDMTTIIVLTLGTIPAGITDQDLTVDFDIIYPAGNGLTNVPKEVLKVYEVVDNVNYSFVTSDDADGIRPNSSVPASGTVASDYRIGMDPQLGFTTLVEYALTGNGTASYTIPAALGGIPITHIHKITVDTVPVSKFSVTPRQVTSVQKNFDGSITVGFNSLLTGVNALKFYVGLGNNAVSLDKQTKAIDEIAESVVLTKTALAGSNLTRMTFDAESPVFSAQATVKSALTGDYQSYCFVDGNETECTYTFEGAYVIVDFDAPVGVGVNNVVEIAIVRAKNLDMNKRMQVFYIYNPYQGVTSRVSFNKGANSYVKTKMVEKAFGFLVHTSGTGGKNASVNDNYSPMSVKLPLPAAHQDSMLENNPLGAALFPTHKGIDPAVDLTVMGTLGVDSFESYNDWYEEGFDTQVARDNYRQMFMRDSIRVNKVGGGSSIAYLSKDTINQNFAPVVDTTGNLVGGKRLVFWAYIPDNTKVLTLGLHLVTAGGDHVYKQVGGFKIGWNRFEFTARNDGTAITTTVLKYQFRFELLAPSTILYGMNIVAPYLEDASVPVDELKSPDLWYSLSEETLVKFTSDRGMTTVSDGVGIELFKDRASAFDIPVLSGVHSLTSDKNSPYVLGQENLISKVGVTNTRGTHKGSNFYSIGMATVASTNKQTVMYMLEQVLEDPTGNFVPGEYVLRVETRISPNRTVEITNDDFDNLNSYDLYRCKGRPLGRV